MESVTTVRKEAAPAATEAAPQQTGGGQIVANAQSQEATDGFHLVIDALKLKRPIYRKTAAYGHFGRKPSSGTYQADGRQLKVDYFTWEETDRVKDLLSAAH